MTTNGICFEFLTSGFGWIVMTQLNFTQWL